MCCDASEARNIDREAIEPALHCMGIAERPVRRDTWYGRPGVVRRCAQPSPPRDRDESVIPLMPGGDYVSHAP